MPLAAAKFLHFNLPFLFLRFTFSLIFHMKSKIEQKVMASVGAIYIGRKLVSLTAIKLYILCVSLIAIASLVSVPHVFANLTQVGPTGLYTFAVAAALNTKLLVQLGLLACTLVGISFVADALRTRLSSRGSLAM